MFFEVLYEQHGIFGVYCTFVLFGIALYAARRGQLPTRVKQLMDVEAKPNVEWALDFMSDCLYHGSRRFRTLNVLDEGVREVVDTSIPGGRVVRTLERLVEWHGRPKAIRVDNGPEL